MNQHVTYLIGLFVLSIVLNLPLLIFFNKISAALTDFFSIHEYNNSIGHVLFFFMLLLNYPLLVELVPQRFYIILYILFSLFLQFINPYSFITTVYEPPYLFFFTFILFGSLLPVYNFIKPFLLVLLAIALQNEFMSVIYYKDIITFIGYLSFYCIGYYLTWKLIPLFEIFHIIKYIVGALVFLVLFLVSWVSRMFGLVRESAVSNAYSIAIVAFLVMLALCHLYIRRIGKHSYGGKLLVHNPIDLDKVSSYKIQVDYTYTISYWFYINPTPPSYLPSSTEDTPIITHGNVAVTYNGLKNNLKVNLDDTTIVDVFPTLIESSLHTPVPLQKWNHMAIMYNNGIMDIFLNGKLQQSSSWSPETLSEELIIGATNGIYGSICNVLYYNNKISSPFVKSLYYDFKDKTPPTL